MTCQGPFHRANQAYLLLADFDYRHPIKRSDSPSTYQFHTIPPLYIHFSFADIFHLTSWRKGDSSIDQRKLSKKRKIFTSMLPKLFGWSKAHRRSRNSSSSPIPEPDEIMAYLDELMDRSRPIMQHLSGSEEILTPDLADCEPRKTQSAPPSLGGNSPTFGPRLIEALQHLESSSSSSKTSHDTDESFRGRASPSTEVDTGDYDPTKNMITTTGIEKIRWLSRPKRRQFRPWRWFSGRKFNWRRNRDPSPCPSEGSTVRSIEDSKGETQRTGDRAAKRRSWLRKWWYLRITRRSARKGRFL
ncbi:hypothetical protein GGS21DRAFT_68862 [Xylaria nigripes]|nr:hypothetical protein GGS21DRAFT_68862 [Xylaria nigripes]